MADGAIAADAAGAGAEHGASFPPFDASLFQHQAVWLILTFAVLYGLLTYYVLPRIGAAIAQRKSTIDGDLDAAANANAAAKAASEFYDRSLQAARLEARQMADTARTEAIQAQSRELAQADARLSERLAQAEQRLEAARAAGLVSAKEAATDAAQAILVKLLPQTNEGAA